MFGATVDAVLATGSLVGCTRGSWERRLGTASSSRRMTPRVLRIGFILSRSRLALYVLAVRAVVEHAIVHEVPLLVGDRGAKGCVVGLVAASRHRAPSCSGSSALPSSSCILGKARGFHASLKVRHDFGHLGIADCCVLVLGVQARDLPSFELGCSTVTTAGCLRQGVETISVVCALDMHLGSALHASANAARVARGQASKGQHREALRLQVKAWGQNALYAPYLHHTASIPYLEDMGMQALLVAHAAGDADVRGLRASVAAFLAPPPPKAVASHLTQDTVRAFFQRNHPFVIDFLKQEPMLLVDVTAFVEADGAREKALVDAFREADGAVSLLSSLILDACGAKPTNIFVPADSSCPSSCSSQS